MGTFTPYMLLSPIKMVLAPPTLHHASALAPAVVVIPSSSVPQAQNHVLPPEIRQKSGITCHV